MKDNDMDKDENKDEDMYKTNNEDEGKSKGRDKNIRMMTRVRSKVLGMTTKKSSKRYSQTQGLREFCLNDRIDARYLRVMSHD